MSEWIPYEGKGEKPEWLPDDCKLRLKFRDGEELGALRAGVRLCWVNGDNDPGSDTVAFKIVDERYQHLVPPDICAGSGDITDAQIHLGHPWWSAQEAENCRVLEKAIGDEVVAAALGPIATELAPVFEKVKYNVYRGAELLGTVEIEERPGMTQLERQSAAAEIIRPGSMFMSDCFSRRLTLRRVTASTGRRRGFIR